MQLQRDFKKVHDNIWGDIRFSNIADCFLSSPFFFALKNKKQLGACSFIFNGANHTRFEHSLGVYHLAHQLLKRLHECTYDKVIEDGRIILETKTGIQDYLRRIPYLEMHFKEHNMGHYYMDDKLCEMIAISGLCHDIGHGPFSHLFDDLITCKLTTANRNHESRSTQILEYIVKNHEGLNQYFNSENIEFMKKIIHPSSDCNGFIFQIICNELNGLDVDKFDYLRRDTYNLGLPYTVDVSNLLQEIDIIENNICYSTKCYRLIADVFKTRHKLHTEIYTHPKVVAVHYMIGDILKGIAKPLEIMESIKDIAKFYVLQDDIIYGIMRIDEMRYTGKARDKLVRAKQILCELMQHNIYKFVGSLNYTVAKELDIARIVQSVPELKSEDIIIHQIRYNYTSSLARDIFGNVGFYDRERKLVKMEGPMIIDTPYRLSVYVKNPDKTRQAMEVYQSIGSILTQ